MEIGFLQGHVWCWLNSEMSEWVRVCLHMASNKAVSLACIWLPLMNPSQFILAGSLMFLIFDQSPRNLTLRPAWFHSTHVWIMKVGPEMWSTQLCVGPLFSWKTAALSCGRLKFFYLSLKWQAIFIHSHFSHLWNFSSQLWDVPHGQSIQC